MLKSKLIHVFLGQSCKIPLLNCYMRHNDILLKHLNYVMPLQEDRLEINYSYVFFQWQKGQIPLWCFGVATELRYTTVKFKCKPICLITTGIHNRKYSNVISGRAHCCPKTRHILKKNHFVYTLLVQCQLMGLSWDWTWSPLNFKV